MSGFQARGGRQDTTLFEHIYIRPIHYCIFDSVTEHFEAYAGEPKHALKFLMDTLSLGAQGSFITLSKITSLKSMWDNNAMASFLA